MLTVVTDEQQCLPVDSGGDCGQCVCLSRLLAALAVHLQRPQQHFLHHLRVGAQVPGLVGQQLQSCVGGKWGNSQKY